LKRYYLSRIILKHSADYYISISEQMTKELVDLGINKNTILYLPNGVDVHTFKPNVPKEDDLLLFVGRVTSSKGLHTLIKSLRFLEKPIRLAIIGPMDPIYRPYIEKLVEKENQKEKHEITFLGAMDRTAIVKWYQRASIFVLPSFWEGFPVTILEALSCETPIIATPVGGIPEVIKDHKTGILTPLNNPVALGQNIQYLLDNTEVRNQLGREGRRQIIKNYSLQESVEKLIKIYKQISF
jgi:teichuronic acid biosynthesis glycosyltransferase TuaC